MEYVLLNSESEFLECVPLNTRQSKRYFVSLEKQVRTRLLLNRQEGVAKSIKFQSKC